MKIVIDFSYNQIAGSLNEMNLDDVVFFVNQDAEVNIQNKKYLISDSTNPSFHTDWNHCSFVHDEENKKVSLQAYLEYGWYDEADGTNAINKQIEDGIPEEMIMEYDVEPSCIALYTHDFPFRDLKVDAVTVHHNAHMIAYGKQILDEIVIESDGYIMEAAK